MDKRVVNQIIKSIAIILSIALLLWSIVLSNVSSPDYTKIVKEGIICSIGCILFALISLLIGNKHKINLLIHILIMIIGSYFLIGLLRR